MVKGIIFDLWETLGTKNMQVSETLRTRFALPKQGFLEKYEAAVQLQPWRDEQAMAMAFLDAFSLPHRAQDVHFVEQTFRSGIAKATPFEGMDELLRELHKTHKLCILSNTTVFESTVIKEWGLKDCFDAQLYSWQLGSLKPSTQSFLAACQRIKLPPTECIMIDDSEKNVAAARTLGMSGIRFCGIKALREDLKRAKVLSP